MALTQRTSLSAPDDVKPAKPKSAVFPDYDLLAAPQQLSQRKVPAQRKEQARFESLSIPVDDPADSFVPGILHLPADLTTPTPQTHHRTAAILLSGAGGGIVGPSAIYLGLAAKLAALGNGIPALRLDYRFPARNRFCVADVLAAMAYLQDMYGLDRFVLVGWSFGGAPVFTVAGRDERVVGCATVASQTAQTEGIAKVKPRPLLLMHGTGDRTLSYRCSERLWDNYGGEKVGKGQLKLFDGDDHALTRNARIAEGMLVDFVVCCAGLKVDVEELTSVEEQELVGDGDRLDLMRKGGDLAEPESVE